MQWASSITSSPTLADRSGRTWVRNWGLLSRSGEIGSRSTRPAQRNSAGLGLAEHGLRLQIPLLVGPVVDPLVPTKEPQEPTTVTPAEIIYHRRVQVLDRAGQTSVTEACRTFGISRTTYYRWAGRAQRYGPSRSARPTARGPAWPPWPSSTPPCPATPPPRRTYTSVTVTQ